jgi:hypothetical protein
MSISTIAIFPHYWPDFCAEYIQQLAELLAAHKDSAVWRQCLEFRSPEEEFATQGSTMFHVGNEISLFYGKRLLVVDYAGRWTAFLSDSSIRQRFDLLVRRIVCFLRSGEALLLPEGTELMDCFYEGADFATTKRFALDRWGQPDLDPSKLYTLHEIETMPKERIHYFLLGVPNNPE